MQRLSAVGGGCPTLADSVTLQPAGSKFPGAAVLCSKYQLRKARRTYQIFLVISERHLNELKSLCFVANASAIAIDLDSSQFVSKHLVTPHIF